MSRIPPPDHNNVPERTITLVEQAEGEPTLWKFERMNPGCLSVTWITDRLAKVWQNCAMSRVWNALGGRGDVVSSASYVVAVRKGRACRFALEMSRDRVRPSEGSRISPEAVPSEGLCRDWVRIGVGRP